MSGDGVKELSDVIYSNVFKNAKVEWHERKNLQEDTNVSRTVSKHIKD